MTDYKYHHKIKSAKEFEDRDKYLHAIQIYKTLINEYPDLPDPYINLADLFQVKGQKKSAERVLKEILDRNPDNIEIKLYYVQLLMQNKNWNKALGMLEEIPSEEPFVRYLTGYCHFRLESFEEAKVHLTKFFFSFFLY